MSKSMRLKKIKRQEQERKQQEFLKLISLDKEEPDYFIATLPGVGSVDITNEMKERKVS